ncbi:MAG: murein hydrolase activator EnvC family protein [Butyrivibrio sp.]
MMKKNYKKILLVVSAFALAATQFGRMSYAPVMAVEQGDIDEAKGDVAQKEEEIKKLKEELAALSSDIKSTQEYITQLDSMLSTLTAEVNECQAKVDAKQLEIEEKQAQIDAKQIEINNTQVELENAQLEEKEQYEAMSHRIQYMYECGDESFLDMIFSAEDMSDLLGRSEYIANITEYDREQLKVLINTKENIDLLLTRLENEIKALDDEKVVLENEKKELDALVADAAQRQASVDAVLENKQNTLQTLENQQAYTEEQKAAAEQELRDQQAILAALEAKWEEEKKNNPNAESDAQKTLETIGLSGGFTWPLPGYNRITSEWGMRPNPVTGVYMLHDGFDISGYAVNGKPIVAAYSGTVILSQYYWGYGNCVQISHGAGVVTLYAHCSSLAVKVGDVVQAGQVIGYVGSTGNSTGPHLHFSLFVQGQSVNPRAYLTIPS